MHFKIHLSNVTHKRLYTLEILTAKFGLGYFELYVIDDENKNSFMLKNDLTE